MEIINNDEDDLMGKPPIDNNKKNRKVAKNQSKVNVMQELAPYASLGLQLVITILVGAYAGWWIDGKYDTSPIFLIILTFLGATVGMVTFIKTAVKRKK